jgi:hypothetical protein
MRELKAKRSAVDHAAAAGRETEAQMTVPTGEKRVQTFQQIQNLSH